MVEICRQPAIGRVTVAAIVTARYVRGGLTGRRHAVVAGSTGAEHLCVIDSYGRRIGYGAVAILADICRLDMRRTFTRSRNAVMAGYAITDDANMVKQRRQPTRNIVAIVALVVG
jgi:hypothetical protein